MRTWERRREQYVGEETRGEEIVEDDDVIEKEAKGKRRVKVFNNYLYS